MSQASTGGGGGGGGGTVTEVLAGLNINITGTPTIVPVVNLNDTVDLPDTNMTGTEGVYLFNSVKFMHNRGTLNTFLGADAGTLILTTASSVENTGIGAGALSGLTTGADNTCVGLLAGYLITTGSNNCIFGSGSGASMSANASNNILINHPGAAESNTIRLGYQGSGPAQQDKTYIAGIYNTSIGATYTPVAADSTGKLGTVGTIVTLVHSSSGDATPASNAFTIAAGTGIATTGSGSTVTIAATGAVPTVIHTDSGDATPASNAFSIVGGTNVTTSGSGSTVTINASGGSGGLTWSEVTGTTQAMAVSHGYIANNAGVVTLTLPATAALGDVMEILGKGAGGWLLAQNSGQTVHFGTSNTTTGTGGSLASTQRYDNFIIKCITANTDFTITGPVGNLTVV